MIDQQKLGHWDLETLKARIASSNEKTRHEAGSPNQQEADHYRTLLASSLGTPAKRDQRALVLGMTPELRSIALKTGARVISVDNNLAAIELYRDWVPEHDRCNEEIIRSDWLKMDRSVTAPVNVVLGDGIFGNILSLHDHVRLLCILKNLLRPGGAIIVRQALIPQDFPLVDHNAYVLLAKFRDGLVTEAEFGFGMRLWGRFNQAYHRDTFLLDNHVVFTTYREWLAQQRLTQTEFDLIGRYYYKGLNMILPQADWESLLRKVGLSFEMRPLTGRSWYAYYPIYTCCPATAG